MLHDAIGAQHALAADGECRSLHGTLGARFTMAVSQDLGYLTTGKSDT
jgi:hypothetical protein